MVIIVTATNLALSEANGQNLPVSQPVRYGCIWPWLWLRGGDLGSRGEITAVQLMGLTFLWLGWLSWLYWI